MRRSRSDVRGDAIGALERLLERPIAHRGLHGCGAAPIENSLGAARAAIAGGYNIECDVRLTRDGQLVVFHDADLMRLTGHKTAMRDVAVADLAAMPLAGGQVIPTLAALLATVANRAVVVVEVKASAEEAAQAAEALAASLQNFGGCAVVESFEAAVVRRCINLPCPIGLVGQEDSALALVGALPRCEFVSWHVDTLAHVVARFPDLPRTAWTVRSAEQREQAMMLGAQSVFEGFAP